MAINAVRIASDDTNMKPQNALLKATTTPNTKGSRMLPTSPLKLMIPEAASLADWDLLQAAVVMFGVQLSSMSGSNLVESLRYEGG